MAPERVITPHRASYLMIALSLAVIGLAAWSISLNSRVGTQEEVRRVEARQAKARAASECRSRVAGTKLSNGLLLAMKDLATIPQTNLRTYLAGPLDPMTRSNYEDALARYERAEAKFVPLPIPKCARSAP